MIEIWFPKKKRNRAASFNNTQHGSVRILGGGGGGGGGGSGGGGSGGGGSGGGGGSCRGAQQQSRAVLRTKVDSAFPVSKNKIQGGCRFGPFGSQWTAENRLLFYTPHPLAAPGVYNRQNVALFPLPSECASCKYGEAALQPAIKKEAGLGFTCKLCVSSERKLQTACIHHGRRCSAVYRRCSTRFRRLRLRERSHAAEGHCHTRS